MSFRVSFLVASIFVLGVAGEARAQSVTVTKAVQDACASGEYNQFCNQYGIGSQLLDICFRQNADHMAGLHDGPGRPRTHGDEQVAALINRVLHTKPKGATHWSVRLVAEETGISKSTVGRYFKLFGLQPQRSKSFKLSTDPFFVEKVRDIVGLYLNPPDHALVLCVDEKSQVQALERTQPILPLGLGYVEGVTHDYFRHGTTTLFAALNVLDGSVITQCKPRHRHQEFLAFLQHLDHNIPPTSRPT